MELGNFSKISFNLGPTLLEWMIDYDLATAQKILEQERNVYAKSDLPLGLAQSFNHTILPLATERDKKIQIKWGLSEFQLRFEHRPKGIWFPEAAVDDETLRIAAECGFEFVILAPWQCQTAGANMNQPAWVNLGNGKRIAVFFYNQGLSTRVSFDPGSTSNADDFMAHYLVPEFSNGAAGKKSDKFIIIASDGELYGHHQKFRDQFLARLTSGSLKRNSILRLSPAEWLQRHPPQQEVSILQRSSWSCHHGVSRWSDNCGCTPHSDWKSPLRSALNLVAELIDPVYQNACSIEGIDPDQLLESYIQVILGVSTMEEFLQEKLTTPTMDTIIRFSFLLRAQYERQRMFTSCGWFFDDFDRIEPRNNVKYAAQSVWFTSQVDPDLDNVSILKAFNKVVSPRTDLHADQVFLQHTRLAQSVWSNSG